MKLIYENLDTSFINLPALVRYLRGKRFDGNIRLELTGYEAEIIFNGDDQPNAREHDRNAGRIAEGEQALQRVLIRAREAGGVVNVYQTSETKMSPGAENRSNANQATANEKINEEINKKKIDDENSKNSNAAQHRSLIVENSTSKTNPGGKSAAFPFEFSNNVEAKAKQNQLSDDDWRTLSSLIGELLRTIDEKLASANLNFTAAFQKACAEVSEDYPFLNPNSGAFAYRSGKVEIRETVNAKLFVAGINETLRRILLRLNSNPNFAEAERETVQGILALIHHRKPLYDKFYITPQLEKTLRA